MVSLITFLLDRERKTLLNKLFLIKLNVLDNNGIAHVVNYDLVMLPIDWTTKEMLMLSTMT